MKHFVVIPAEIQSVADEFGWKRAFLVNKLKLQAVNVSRKLHVKQHGEKSNKTTKEETKKSTLVI